MVDISIFSKIYLPMMSVGGAFVLYMSHRNSGKEPLSLFKALNIDVSGKTGKPLAILSDMMLTSAIGGYLVFLMVAPTTAAQAVVAGLGMTGMLSVQGKSR